MMPHASRPPIFTGAGLPSADVLRDLEEAPRPRGQACTALWVTAGAPWGRFRRPVPEYAALNEANLGTDLAPSLAAVDLK